MKTIGNRIKELRDLRNMTQQQLADLMGESSGRVIYNWEKSISRPDSDKNGIMSPIARREQNVAAFRLYGSR